MKARQRLAATESTAALNKHWPVTVPSGRACNSFLLNSACRYSAAGPCGGTCMYNYTSAQVSDCKPADVCASSRSPGSASRVQTLLPRHLQIAIGRWQLGNTERQESDTGDLPANAGNESDFKQKLETRAPLTKTHAASTGVAPKHTDVWPAALQLMHLWWIGFSEWCFS